ncbi:uncharacterized protein LOC108683131 [Hyalella azteca]|uniref:Uncharacterized protein LOC108683131 n=1 Tax=Hyalella azteca TaxID=294128 RepID=A0A8B7PR05_HYAAZ|nr:uncharacterized protein LOC108683131 [Hyalella azteca]
MYLRIERLGLLFAILVLYSIPKCIKCNLSPILMSNDSIIYPMDCNYKIVSLDSNTSTKVRIEGVNFSNTSFLIVQAHSQSRYILLSSQPELVAGNYTNATNAGLFVPLNASRPLPPLVYITNAHHAVLQVLLLVRPYTNRDPIPGGAAASPMPEPYLQLFPSILTTLVTVPPASPSLRAFSGEDNASWDNSPRIKIHTKTAVKTSVEKSDSLISDTAEHKSFNATQDSSLISHLFSFVTKKIKSGFRNSNDSHDSIESLTRSSQVNFSGKHIFSSDSRNEKSAERKLRNDVTTEAISPSSTAAVTTNSILDDGESGQTKLLYEVYLSYMYEGDMQEEHYWRTVVETSSPQLLRARALKVASFLSDSNDTSSPPSYLFVSYSGVGAVISVLVTNVRVANTSAHDVLRLTNGSLYSSSVSYGCDFIPDEQHRCTKLVDPLPQMFCASLLFVGLVLCFVGHRWLNFTMFTAGFLGAWFILFVTFVHVPKADLHMLALGTFEYSLVCGVLWLLLWHKLQRPFVSALLVILEAGLLTAMTTTHFLKYALVPTPSNVAVFVVIPVLFALCLVAYSFRNIKAVHILSCVLVGSYAATVPLSFYFGCTLNYIAINAVAAMTVPGYTAAIGFPPFQTCDIVLLTLWFTILSTGLAYQRYRERHSPPFPPPNLQYWRAARRAGAFLYTQASACFYRTLRRAPPDGGSSYSNVYSSEEHVVENGNGVVPEQPPPQNEEVETNIRDEEGFLSSSVRSNLNSAKNWITSVMGLRNRSPFPDYHSFPRHPTEDLDEADDVEGTLQQNIDVPDDPCLSLPSGPSTSLWARAAQTWTRVKSTVSERFRIPRLFRPRPLVPDCPDDVVSSGSSEGEVDRRADGIFGEAETPGDVSDRVFANATDEDLADGGRESFRSSQLTFQRL